MTSPQWPQGTPRVLFTDCWLQNAGDALIAVAMQDVALRARPGAAIVHAAYGADDVGHRYADLTLVPPLEDLVGTRWKPASVEGGRDFVAEADVIISQGGGFLRAGYQPWARIDALERVVRGGVRFGLLGQTVGSFDLSFARRSLRAILTSAEAVVVRDIPSLDSVVELGADRQRVRLGTDYSLSIIAAERRTDFAARSTVAPPSNDAIGVVLSDHEVPGESPARGQVAKAVLDAVLRATDRDLVVWSSSQGVPGSADDDLVADRAIAELDLVDRQRVRVAHGHLDAYDLLRWSDAFPALVSMRFHPALLAAATGRRATLIMADRKTAFFAGSAMAQRVVAVQDVKAVRTAVRSLLRSQQEESGHALLGPVLDRVTSNDEVLMHLVTGA